jgi:hypothetical protein
MANSREQELPLAQLCIIAIMQKEELSDSRNRQAAPENQGQNVGHIWQRTATHTARDSNLDSGNHDMSRLSSLAYLNDAPIHGLTDMPLRLISTDNGCGTLAPRSRRDTATHAARD